MSAEQDLNNKNIDPSKVAKDRVPGVFVFIIADMIVFAMLFAGFMDERSKQVELFKESASQLSVIFGVLNTIILVTSGLFIVLAVEAAREGKLKQFRGWLLASFIVGAGFGINKLIEYQDKLSHDITMLTNEFFMFYYALTGAHFLHFLGGMAAIAFIGYRSFKEDIDKELFPVVQSVALYWHMVDLLWIFIFPLIYLVSLS